MAADELFILGIIFIRLSIIKAWIKDEALYSNINFSLACASKNRI